jgi:hypothetical protein
MISTPDTISLNEYCSMFGLTTIDDLIEMTSEWVWETAVDSASDLEPQTPEWEAKVDSNSGEIWDGINKSYFSSLDSTFQYLAELGVIANLNEKDSSITFSSKDWEGAAVAVLESINGYGLFHYEDTEDLISSGPYPDTRGAVISHLHWHKSRGEVYGETGIKRIFDLALERAFRYL